MKIFLFIFILKSTIFAGDISFSNKDVSQIYKVICDSVIRNLDNDTFINISDYVFIIDEAENHDIPFIKERYSPKQDTAALDVDLFCASLKSILNNNIYKKTS